MIHRFGLFMAFIVVLSACQEPTEELEASPAIRAVKLFTVSDLSGASERTFSGTTVATTTASLRFPVSGKITEILVNEGDKVTKGQLLAKLDATSFERASSMALAQSRQAQVIYEDKQGDYNRKKPLADKGVITQRDIEEIKAAMLSAEEELNLAQTNLRLAKDNQQDTLLYSPYDGVISDRSSEPFVEITAGQEILVLESQGAIEVEIAVPESIIEQVEIGQTAEISLKTTNKALTGTITEIAVSADVGNVFAVKITIDESVEILHSGLSAEVVLQLGNASVQEGVMIPLSCIAAGNDNHNYVYVYQAESGSVKKTMVIPVSTAPKGNSVAVTGINAGDQIVSAGVSFISDGLQVKPFQASK